LNSIRFINQKTGIAVGDRGTIIRSNTGGVTWTSVPLEATEDLFSVDFVTTELGWIVGARGIILHTDDGGETWHMQRANTLSWLEDVRFTDPQHGIAVDQAERFCARKTAAKPGNASIRI